MTPSRKKRTPPRRDRPNRGGGTKAVASSGRRRNGAGPIDLAVDVARKLGKVSGATVKEGLETARRIARSSETTVLGAVERGVDTAYMVIEEYMLRGRRAAGRYHERKNGGDTMGDEQRGADWSSMFSPSWFMAPWMATMRMWTDAMSQMVPGGPAASRAWMDQMMTMAAPWWGAGAALAPRLSFEVMSANPAEVSATIDPLAYFTPLTVGAMKSTAQPDGPSISDVSITSSAGHVCVHVTVPDGLPKGTYSAQVNDESGIRRGQVTLELKAPAGAPSSGRPSGKSPGKSSGTP
jgi:hypothetical protein